MINTGIQVHVRRNNTLKNSVWEQGVDMEKYSVLLVDDEEDVIQIIMKKIDWESMGFCVVGYAHNGVEALEMAEEL